MVRLEKPCPHTVYRTPEHHLGPVVLSPADTADFRASVHQRQDTNAQLSPVRWLTCLQRAIYDWAKAADRVRTFNFSGTTARGTVAGHRLGAPEEGGGGYLRPFQCIPADPPDHWCVDGAEETLAPPAPMTRDPPDGVAPASHGASPRGAWWEDESRDSLGRSLN